MFQLLQLDRRGNPGSEQRHQHVRSYRSAYGPANGSDPVGLHQSLMRIRGKPEAENGMSRNGKHHGAEMDEQQHRKRSPAHRGACPGRQFPDDKQRTYQFNAHERPHQCRYPKRVRLLVSNKSVGTNLSEQRVVHYLNRPDQSG